MDTTLAERALGLDFHDESLLQRALTHRSYLNENPDYPYEDNERLEFLGDAVLDVVITHILMRDFPESREGDLSRMRATIVKESQLAMVAQRLNLGQHLLLGRGEASSNGQEKTSILADALEAVIAAVYLDGGLQAVFDVIERQFSEILPEAGQTPAAEDFKSRLQELVQARFKTIPHYKVMAENGPDHDKTFEVRLSIGSLVTSQGTGKSKKAAEQAAARIALQELQDEAT